ncbi:type II toxin-antitoxin system RelE family toxin [Microcystis aeruginosa]|uniref:type II toxin-antitoxin system RelE family toxin n=1 Tax=Microcystis aeruginosa TaxID=1126 RepID=UPI003B518853
MLGSIPPAPLDKGGADRRGDLKVFNTYLLIRLRILNKIKWLAINFEQITPLPLTREWSGFYKLRVGDYRVIYEFDRESRIIIRVGHRSEVYD